MLATPSPVSSSTADRVPSIRNELTCPGSLTRWTPASSWRTSNQDRRGKSLPQAVCSSRPPPLMPVPRLAVRRPGSPGHRRNDGDLVLLRQWGVQALPEPDVLVVEEQVDELPRLAVVVQEAALET